MKPLLLILVIILCLSELGRAATAQTQTITPQPPTLFSQLFPKPTGLNGYEEFVAAADIVRGNTKLNAASQPEATLAVKRAALNDRDLQNALALVREGLNKPITSPRDIDKFNADKLLPEMAQFRALARLMALEQYVLFAEGRTDTAIDRMKMGLRFGYTVQTDSLISGLVGIAIDRIIQNGLTRHLDQLNYFDCISLKRFVRDWLTAESPLIAVMEKERHIMKNMLMDCKNDPAQLWKLIDQMTAESPFAMELATYLDNHPGDADAIINDTLSDVNLHFDKVVANLKLPYWKQQEEIIDSHSAKTVRLYYLLAPSFGQVRDKYVMEDARMRLMGVEAAIRQYKWEHSILPSSLSQLDIKDIAIDPFTGKQLMYQVKGTTYELTSAGAYTRDDAGQQSAKTRSAITLP